MADAYDVITSARSYKKPMTAEAARRELVRCSGTQFDPDVVRAMVSVSLGRRRNAGPFAFLTELPRVIDIARVATSAPGAVLVPAAVVALGATTTLPSTTNVPDELAFTAPTVTIVEEDASDASTTSVTSPADTITVTELNTTTTTSLPLTTTSTVATTGSIAESTATGATGSSPPSTSAPPTTEQANSTTTAPTSAPTTMTTETSTTTTEPPAGAPPPPPPSGPVTADDDVSVDNGRDKKILVLANDSDGAFPIEQNTLTIVTPPENAESFRVHESGGVFHIHYKPTKDYEGPDTIVYSVCDTVGTCSTGTINITVS